MGARAELSPRTLILLNPILQKGHQSQIGIWRGAVLSKALKSWFRLGLPERQLLKHDK